MPRLQCLLYILTPIAILVFITSPVFAGAFTVYGPETFQRGTGVPVTVTRTFTVFNPNKSYTLKIYNGGLVDDEFEMVSSSDISLNALQIFGPDQFNQNVQMIETAVTLLADDTLTVEVRGKPGGAIIIEIIGLDDDPPNIMPSVNPLPNPAGWNNADVTVTYICSDTVSGVASCPGPVTVSTEGAAQAIIGTATDKAGNSNSVSVTINLDKTSPAISFSTSPSPNVNGWYNTDTTVSFTCADDVSGIAACQEPVELTTEGSDQPINGIASDLAGNVSTVDVVANIDKTAPMINITSPENETILNQSKPGVTVDFMDGLSGMDTTSVNLALDGVDVTSDSLITTSGLSYTPTTALHDGTHSILVSASDKANNTGNASATFTTKTKTRSFIFPEPGFDAGSYDGIANIFNGPIKVGDLNRDGISDVVVLNHIAGASASKISVILGKGDGSFQNPINVGETNSGTYDDIAVDDLNGDGFPDLALTVFISNSQYELHLFTGNGDGTFTTGTNFTINAPGKILTGMFDAEPYEDIAIAGQDGGVILYLGNGNGSFSSPTTAWSGTVGSRITDAVSADFNHDGLADIGLIAGDSSGGHAFLVLLNSGDGAFQSSDVIPWDASFYFSNLTFGDLNGDGFADVLMLRDGQFYFRPDVMIFMNDGSGNFPDSHIYSPGLVIPSGNYSISGSRTIRLGDLNGDRKLDLLISFFGTVFTFLGKGDGTFDPPSGLTVSGGSLNIGDFDQDGVQDLVTVGLDHIFTLFGRGDGGFIDREEIPTSNGNYDLISADLDGDRNPDLAIPGFNFGDLFSTILNRGNAWIENSVSPPFQADRTYRAGTSPVFVKTGDLNKDGYPDLVVANELSNDVSVLLSSGNGDLNAAVSYPAGSAPIFVDMGDFNKDGNLDIVSANSGSNDISVLLGRSDGSYQAQKTYSAGPNPKSLAIADIDSDGYPDIVVVDYDFSVNYISILLGNGDGTFQPYYPWTTIGRFPIAIQTGDYNRDGLADFAVANYSLYSSGGIQSSMVTLLLGKGDGTFDERIAYQSGNAYVFDDILSGDLNRDGKQDLIVFDYHAASAWVFLNDGYGLFNEIKPVGGLEGLLVQGGLSATLGDLDHDGNLDLLAGGLSSLHPWFGQGDGTFLSSPSIGGWEDVSSMQIGDIDGDGISDIVLVDGNNLSVIPGEGGGIFPGESVIHTEASDSSFSVIASADFNGDHNQDIIVSDKESTGVYAGFFKATVYWGKGDNTYRRGPTLQTSAPISRGAFAEDFNQDGLADIAISTGNGVLIFLNNGDEAFSEAVSYTMNANVSGIRIADINHDNRFDIISAEWTANGLEGSSYSISIHTGNGDGTFQPYGTIPLEQFDPADVLVRDLNGDGFPDLAASMFLGNTLRIYLNDGNGTFNGPIMSEVGINQEAMIAQDFNHDDFMDLVIRDIESVYLLLGNGDGTFQLPAAYGLGEVGAGGFGGMVSRDFDLDGRMDIAVSPGHSSINNVKLILNLLAPLRTPPSPPKNLAGVAGDASVTLSWASSPEADLAGYNLYRSASSGGGYVKVNAARITSLSYLDTPVTNGQLYYYAISAINPQGDESSFSKKVKVTPHPADTIPPVVKITTPVNGGITVSPLLFVSGTIDDVDAKATVNGISAAVQTQSGTFTAYNIPLILGLNIITVTAVDSAGNRSSDTVTVSYALPAGMKGTVQDARTGSPIPGATVSIQDSDGTQSLTTDATGLYSFTPLVPGQVTITVTTPTYYHYQSLTLVKTLSPGQAMTLDIPLELLPAILTGTVYDSYPIIDNPKPWLRVYKPIDGATVSVTDRVKSQTVVTDADGKYRVENITPYDITVTVVKAGYDPHEEYQFISPGQTEGIDYFLNKLPPAAPTGLAATPVIRGVELKWNPNTESDLLGYNVYRATTSGDGYSLLNTNPVTSPSYMDAGLTGGTSYYYVVTAINTSRRESDFSAEALATTPSPTVPISITSPANGAGINSSSVVVTGTIDATLNEIGVVIEVNGPNGIESVPAHVNRSSFAALVPLQAGSNTITAVARDPEGSYGEASIAVDASIPAEDVILSANPSSGVPDIATGALNVKLQVLMTLPNPVTQYQWDYDGNGAIDQTGSELDQITVQYQAMGIYYPTVSVTDTNGNTFTATTVVNVLSKDELDALLKSKWEGMKAALDNGDIEGAVGYFAELSQNRFRGIFNAVQSGLSQIVSEMSTIQFVHVDNGVAKYRIRRQEGAGEITYYIYFVIDQDGIWKIKQF